MYDQGRREPNVDPGTAQMGRNCGFVKSKIDEENAVVWSENAVISKKKGVLRIFNSFSVRNQVISKKKGLLRNFNGFFSLNQAVHMRLRWAFHFSMSFGFMGPLNTMGPGVIVPHCPPLVGPVYDSICQKESAQHQIRRLAHKLNPDILPETSN